MVAQRAGDEDVVLDDVVWRKREIRWISQMNSIPSTLMFVLIKSNDKTRAHFYFKLRFASATHCSGSFGEEVARSLILLFAGLF